MKGTRKKPDRDGWWWYRKSNLTRWCALRIFEDINITPGYRVQNISQLNGYWSDSPIEGSEGIDE